MDTGVVVAVSVFGFLALLVAIVAVVVVASVASVETRDKEGEKE